jgi:hypothetical protein
MHFALCVRALRRDGTGELIWEHTYKDKFRDYLHRFGYTHSNQGLCDGLDLSKQESRSQPFGPSHRIVANS